MDEIIRDSEGERIYRSSRPFGFAFILVVAATIGCTLFLRESLRGPTTVGRPAPKITAAGWLNGPGPTEKEMQGKVIVVDAWASWCGPCRADAPNLKKLYEQYRQQGVIFIGLTTDGLIYDEANRRYLKETGITFPNGYGAVETLQQLKANFIPQKWVIDRNNRIVWDVKSLGSIEDAIDAALKAAS